jgi:hypothetical protein
VKLLVTTGHPDMERYAHPNLGRLVQPRHYSSIERTAYAGIPWAADNDGFNRVDEDAFRVMLGRLRGLPGCLFVTAPDVYCDAPATLANFVRWRSELDGFPVALVAQNGMRPTDVPWDEIDALFVGGDNAFKLGPDGERLARVARERGKWLHIGRVNGMRRLRYCATLRANSVDGSSWARWKAIYLAGALTAVAQPRQPRLGDVV